MKKCIVSCCLLLIWVNVFSGTVPLDSAQQVAIRFFNRGMKQPLVNTLLQNHLKAANEIDNAYYTFNFDGGGWVIVSANDAANPILAYSSDGFFDETRANPSVRAWLSSYKNQIAFVNKANLKSAIADKEWHSWFQPAFSTTHTAVAPLLTTTWDQTQFYNDSCPADKGAPQDYHGHTPAGCVAVALAQIMKYHAYPAKGIGYNAYTLPKYGAVAANFKTARYHWANMPDKLNSPVPDVAQLLYHCGVAIGMQYDSAASGADFLQANANAPDNALVTYFGYTDSIQAYTRVFDSIGNEIWATRLKIELDKRQPIYYAGCSESSCHAYVCDGYDNSFPTKFHFNWGWGGNGNGYFALTALPNDIHDIAPYNMYNAILTNITPKAATSLVFQITEPGKNNTFAANTSIPVSLYVEEGNPLKFVLYVDNTKIDSIFSAPYRFVLHTETLTSGRHLLKVEGVDAHTSTFETKAFTITAGNFLTLQTLFPASVTESIQYISIADSLVVWATFKSTTGHFATTSNGGTSWNTGNIHENVNDSLQLTNICGINAQVAYACFGGVSNAGGAIYKTDNGGTSWTQQPSANFGASNANWVHFFDQNNGVCMANPVKGAFVIYTSNNGGEHWQRLPASDMPVALSGETGLPRNIDVWGSNIWFGTTKGRIFKSGNKGKTWSVSTLDNNLATVNVRFKDSLNAIAYSTGNVIYTTNNTGLSWAEHTSNMACSALAFVPGTDSVWVNYACTNGLSTDNAHSFYPFDEDFCISYLKFISPLRGWAGTAYNYELGGVPMYKWVATFVPLKKMNITFVITDPNGQPLANALIKLNETAHITDIDGHATYTIIRTGKPIVYTIAKANYQTLTGTLKSTHDTTLQNTLNPLCTVTFNVQNLNRKPVQDISILLNDTFKRTNIAGKAVYNGLEEGEYIYAVFKNNTYVDYGLVALHKQTSYAVNVTYLSDSFYVHRTMPDRIFPNPASDALCLVSDTAITSVKLYSITGTLVLEKQVHAAVVVLPVGSVGNGLYLLQVSRKHASETYKVVIKH